MSYIKEGNKLNENYDKKIHKYLYISNQFMCW